MKRHATARWEGSLADGKGTLTTQSGALENHGYSFEARFEDESGKSGTNPEELLGAAHAGCFAMQLSHMLAEAGTPADHLDAKATVTVQSKDGGGFEITSSALVLSGKVPNATAEDFAKAAHKAKDTCPLSVALGAIDISLDVTLEA